MQSDTEDELVHGVTAAGRRAGRCLLPSCAWPVSREAAEGEGEGPGRSG